MAKKGSSSSKNFKNPLVQALGIVFHRMRGTLGLSSDEVAAKIGLGGSSYRMIEAGSAILHPGRSLNIIKVFDKIEYDPLSRLLVAIQVMETGTETVEDFRNATILLGETDPQLQLIFEQLNPIWAYVGKESPQMIAQNIESSSIPDTIKDYLTTNRYFGLEKERRLDFQLNSMLEDTPSIYLDFILDTLKSLQKHRLHYFPEESRTWESENKHNFTNLYAVIKDARGLLNKKNFESFDYNYLWQPQFQNLHYIFLDEEMEMPIDALKKAFVRNLKEVLQEKHIKYQVELTEFDEAMDKVLFKDGWPQAEALLDLMKQQQEGIPVDVIWIFTLKNGNKVGFISNNDSNLVFYGTTLSYRETSERLIKFQEVWKQLE